MHVGKKIEDTMKGLQTSWDATKMELETTLDATMASLEATAQTLDANITKGKCRKNLEREELVVEMHFYYGVFLTEGATYSCNKAALPVLLPCSCPTPALLLPCFCPAHALLMLCSF